MSEAPERIWAHRSMANQYVDKIDAEGWTQYIRADLAGLPEIELLRAEVERLSNRYEGETALADYWYEMYSKLYTETTKKNS